MTENTAKNPESTQFGTRDVEPDEKTALVRDVFDSVADNYDIMNDLMSGGIHRLWKDHLIRRIRPKAGLHYLDVAGGTGDIAFRINNKINAKMNSTGRQTAYGNNINSRAKEARRSPATLSAKITLCDLNWDMLRAVSYTHLTLPTILLV